MSKFSEERLLLNKFFLFGVCFGICFPIMALGIDLLVKEKAFTLLSVWELHFSNPIHFIIDSAPLVLSLTSFMIGKFVLTREQNYKSKLNKELFEAKEVVRFTKDLLNGDYETVLPPDLAKQPEYASLVELKSHLQESRKAETQKTWISAQLEKFTKLIRENQQDFNTLCTLLLSELAKTLSMGKAAIYIPETDKESSQFLPLVTYAGPKKLADQKISLGEGLIGQALAEGLPKYFVNVPDEVQPVFSGLGQSLPKYLAILPLVFHQKVLGALEIGFLRPLEKHEIYFLEQLADNLASVFSVHQISSSQVR